MEDILDPVLICQTVIEIEKNGSHSLYLAFSTWQIIITSAPKGVYPDFCSTPSGLHAMLFNLSGI